MVRVHSGLPVLFWLPKKGGKLASHFFPGKASLTVVNNSRMLATPHPVQRSHPRFAFDRRIHVICGNGQVLHGRCTTISSRGVGAVIAGALALDQTVEVELPGDPALLLNATVRNTNGFHFGFEFSRLTTQQRVALTTLVRLAAGD